MKIKNLKLKIIFFGSSKFVIPILEVLRKNFDLKLVLTTENPKPLKNDLASQGDALRSYPVVECCVENKIPYLSVQQPARNASQRVAGGFSNLIIQQLQKVNAPVAVLADFGLIIPKQILNAFPKGIINIHPSLLPKYRGPTPVQTAILNGEKVTGVSIMKLDEEIDHGPILGQEKEKILDTDTSESLYQRLFEKGANLLLEVLPNYLNGGLNPTAQDHKKATFTPHLARKDGYLDVSNAVTAVTTNDTDRKIRAYYPWPGVWTNIMINDKLLRIKFLPNQKIQISGKKPMSYKDFINGYPQVKQLHVLLKNL